ncbi:MAG: FecR domain-containing protein [Flavobacterium sp.]|uniref:FecR family protein n=1 Tax=Flavobacterium sp. TaxID=239 RepID=UPI003264CC94
MEEINETYLSDWLANKITDEQLKGLVSAEDFVAFQKIKNTLSGVEITNPDLEQNFIAIKQKLADKKQTKQVKVVPIWRYASIAAGLLIFFSLYYSFIAENKIATGYGNTEIITLADNSKVSLNSKSTLAYSNIFKYKRTLQLEGEAFFEVQKGSAFTVETALGDVRVLGTKFNVIAFDDFFEVVCYEGKVKVTQKEKSTILTRGESVRFYHSISENWASKTAVKPSWISGESSFKNVPIHYVINQFENQYNVDVAFPNNIKEVKFTGTFTNKDLQVALQSICLPMHLKFTKNNTGKIIISE